MGKLVWLASYPKSGNTWLRALLHNYLRHPDQPYDINRLNDFCAAENAAELYRHHDPRPASQYSLSDVQRMRPLVHQDLTGAFPDLVFVKTHNAALIVEGVPLVTPAVTAGVIYILRDPRDVALSYADHLGWPVDRAIDFMADPEAATGGTDQKIYEKQSSWSRHVESWTPNPHPNLLILRYEDLLADPAARLSRVIRFLGGEPKPERITKAVEFSSFAELSRQEAAQGFIERPEGVARFFRHGKSGVWRDSLNNAQIARIERGHATVMRRAGYLV